MKLTVNRFRVRIDFNFVEYSSEAGLQTAKITIRGNRVTFSRIVRRAPTMVVTQGTKMIPGIPGSCAASAHHFASFFRSSICRLLVNSVFRVVDKLNKCERTAKSFA